MYILACWLKHTPIAMHRGIHKDIYSLLYIQYIVFGIPRTSEPQKAYLLNVVLGGNVESDVFSIQLVYMFPLPARLVVCQCRKRPWLGPLLLPPTTRRSGRQTEDKGQPWRRLVWRTLQYYTCILRLYSQINKKNITITSICQAQA